MRIASLLYNLIILPALFAGAHAAAPFHAKIRAAITGRKNLFESLRRGLADLPANRPVLVVHAASMGEYEQARPVLRHLRTAFPQHTRCLTVFSPSAFDNLKEPEEADLVSYLPFDSRRQVRTFLDILKPDALLIARHDLWPNLLWEARRREIRTVLFAASVHENSARHWPVVRTFNRAVFRALDAVAPISGRASAAMTKFISKETEVAVCGDPRFEQVVFRAGEGSLDSLLPPYALAWKQAVVAGSTWPEDEAVLVPAVAEVRSQMPELRLVLVPHEPNEHHLQLAEARCEQAGLRSARLSAPDPETDVLIVDRIGVLANIYAAGGIAYVGGGFGPGVHSVIEPAAHGVPVLFGPAMRNSAEAIEMVESGCGVVVRNTAACQVQLQEWLQAPEQLEQVSANARTFVDARTGASAAIGNLLTSVMAGEPPVSKAEQ